MVNLTPLIDVVVILLLFFMLAPSATQWRAINFNMPAEQGGGQPMEGAMRVRVGAAERLDLNVETLTLDGLTRAVRQRLARTPDQRILVRPEDDVTLQRLVVILDRLTRIGPRTSR